MAACLRRLRLQSYPPSFCTRSRPDATVYLKMNAIVAYARCCARVIMNSRLTSGTVQRIAYTYTRLTRVNVGCGATHNVCARVYTRLRANARARARAHTHTQMRTHAQTHARKQTQVALHRRVVRRVRPERFQRPCSRRTSLRWRPACRHCPLPPLSKRRRRGAQLWARVGAAGEE